MTTQEQLTNLQQENSLLNKQIHQLNESLQKSQNDFEQLKSQNDKLIASNLALAEQIAILTSEIGEMKSQLTGETQSTAASSPSSSKGLKRSSLQESDESAKKIKNQSQSWFEATQGSDSSITNNPEPMQLGDKPANQHNLTNNNDGAQPPMFNDDSGGDGFRAVSYKKAKQKQPANAHKSNSDAAKTIKPAPIQVNIGKDGYLALHQALNRKLGSGKFVANNMIANQAVRIQPSDDKSAKSITEFLESNKYGFHTFKNKAERGKCFILRGLNEVSNTENIREVLTQAGFPSETVVTQHTTGFQRAHPEIKHNILFRVVTPNSFDEKVLNEIDALFDLKVKFEKMKGNKIIQCKRCQEYFHTASSCHHPYRCVKCKENHDIGNCPRDANPDLPIRCVNCDGAHSANNFKECKYFQDKIAPILSKKKGQNTQKQVQRPTAKTPSASTTAEVTSGTSFARAVKGPSTSKSTFTPKINNNVSVKPSLSLDEKFDKLLESQLNFQNQVVQMFGSINRAMAPSNRSRYSMK